MDPQQALDVISQEVAAWRRSKRHIGEKWPEVLKNKILALAPYFSKATLCSTLKLSASTLFTWNKTSQVSASSSSLEYTKHHVDLAQLLPISEKEFSSTIPSRKILSKECNPNLQDSSPIAILKCGQISLEVYDPQAFLALCRLLTQEQGQGV